MKALIGNAFLVGLAAAAAAASIVACSSGSPVSNTGSGPNVANTSESTGEIGATLTLPGGAVLTSVNYTINSSTGAVVKSGSVNIANSTTISFLVGGVPAGTGYTITLSSSNDAGVSCLGTSLPFSVTARQTTNVAVQLTCHGTNVPSTGQVQVNGIITDCATWTSIATDPGETTVGNSVSLSFAATGPDLTGLTYTASAPSGSFSAATGTVDATNGATINYTCTQPGTETITLVFGDGPVPPGGATCDTTLDTTTLTVQCDTLGDASVVDTGAPDTGTPDTGVADTGTPDTGVADTGTPDTGVADTGTPDTGVADTGVADASTRDSGPADTGPADTGPADTGTIDSGTGYPIAFLNEVHKYNPTSGGTATEFGFYQKDVANGDTSLACLDCLFSNDCLNNAQDVVSGKECQDVTGVAAGGVQAGTSRTTLCLNTEACLFSTVPTCAIGGDPSVCYCGASNPGTKCQSVAQGTGTCAQVEANGLELPITDPVNINKQFTNTALGAGQLNAIIACAQNNACSTCYQ